MTSLDNPAINIMPCHRLTSPISLFPSGSMRIVGSHLKIPARLTDLVSGYLMSLMLESPKRRQTSASPHGDRNQSQYSRLLSGPLFLESYYGFRPNRNGHQAVHGVNQALYRQWENYGIDLDLENYFGSIEHSKLLALLKIKFKELRFLRLIARMLKARVQ